jgi:phage-related protein
VAWKIEFFRDEDGTVPVALFFEQALLPSEKKALATRLGYLQEHGLAILGIRSDVLEKLQGKEFKGLYSLRIPHTQNNPRVFICTYLNETFVLLHAFKELDDRAYTAALPLAKQRLDLVRESEKKIKEDEKHKEQEKIKVKRAKPKERNRK